MKIDHSGLLCFLSLDMIPLMRACTQIVLAEMIGKIGGKKQKNEFVI